MARSSNILATTRRKRRGVHAKSKHSNHKHSKNYVKKYRGQGKK